jgi:ABC-2 type transport system permease protein
MAVTAPVSTGAFVRLKVRLLRNGMRGQRWRAVAFVLGLVFGVGLAGLGGLFLAGSGLASRDLGLVVATFTGTGVTLGWTLVPLLFFGVDETLDPARFALLPLRRSTLTRGMLAAAFVSVPALATLIATSGLVVAAGLRAGPGPALAAGFGVVGGLVFGVLASRAITSAFAALLRSRRVRDLAAVIIAVLASSVAPIQLLIMSAAANGSIGQAVRVAEVLGWTPFGAPYALPFDVAEDRWAVAGARALITLAAIAGAAYWWGRTIESAMIGVTTQGPKRVATTAGGPVDTLFPRPLRWLRASGLFGAIVAREARTWWRDARRRAGLLSILMASAAVPIAISFGAGGPGAPNPLGALGFSFAVSLAGTMGGMLLANQFAYDADAHAAHLLANVPGRLELRARALAIGFVAVPIQVAVVVVFGVLTDRLAFLPAGLGMLAASFGAAVASAGLLSVLAPYPLPETSNPFALNSGAGTAKSLLALVALVGTQVLAAPVIVLAVLVGGSMVGVWVVLVVGLAYGAAAAMIGTVIAGNVLDQRGPEVLVAITPRR